MSLSNNWIDHALRRTPWRTQRQALALAFLGFFLAVIIGGLYLAQAATISTTGRQLEDLIAERNQLEQANEQLRAEIAQLQSVPRLLARARDLGFTLADPASIEYLVIPGYQPDRNAPVVTPEPENEPVYATYDETFIGWLQEQWDAFTGQFQGDE